MSSFSLNPGMFLKPARRVESAWLGHIPFAGWLVHSHQPRTLVELGTHHGASFLAFCDAAREAGIATQCHAVDTWQGDEHAGRYGEEVYASLAAHVADHHVERAHLLRCTFDEAVDMFADGSIDLLHIDGLHTYDAARHDFETWRSKLSDRAIVLFHDTMVRERDFGVWQLWAELKEQFPSFQFTHSHGLGVLAPTAGGVDIIELLRNGNAGDDVNRLFARLGQDVRQSGDIEFYREAMNARASSTQAYEAALLDEVRRGFAQFNAVGVPAISELRGEVTAAATDVGRVRIAVDALTAGVGVQAVTAEARHQELFARLADVERHHMGETSQVRAMGEELRSAMEERWQSDVPQLLAGLRSLQEGASDSAQRQSGVRDEMLSALADVGELARKSSAGIEELAYRLPDALNTMGVDLQGDIQALAASLKDNGERIDRRLADVSSGVRSAAQRIDDVAALAEKIDAASQPLGGAMRDLASEGKRHLDVRLREHADQGKHHLDVHLREQAVVQVDGLRLLADAIERVHEQARLAREDALRRDNSRLANRLSRAMRRLIRLDNKGPGSPQP